LKKDYKGNFYEPNCSARMMLLLRRTLVRLERKGSIVNDELERTQNRRFTTQNTKLNACKQREFAYGVVRAIFQQQ